MSLSPATRSIYRFAAGAMLCVLATLSHATNLFSRSEGSMAATRPDSERFVQVDIDASALAGLTVGAQLSVSIPGVGRFDYVVQRSSRTEGLKLIEATLKERPAKRLTLGLRSVGAAAYIDTPEGAFVLGYTNQIHWLGVAGHDQSEQAEGKVMILSERRAPSDPFQRAKAPAPLAPPVPDARPVEIDIAALTDLAPGSEAILTLPRLGDVPVVYEQTLNDSGTPTWIGFLRDYGKDFRIVLSFAPSGTQGRILAPSGEYLVVPGPQGDWLVDTLASGLIEPHNEGCAQGEFAAGAATAGAPTAAGTTARVTFAPAADATAETVVDLLVLYTQDLVERLGSVAAVTARIDYLASLANLAYRDGTIPMQIRVVHSAAVTVPITSTNSTALSQLRTATAPFTTVPGLRTQYGADLVVVLRPFRMQEQQGVCGVGYIGGYSGSDVAAYAAYGFSVVADGTDMAGSGYYCQDYTFAHELGHNMGLMHDRATVAAQGGGTGAYPYAFGYGQPGVFGTIMSYIQPRRGRFSNPLDTSCAGQPCGIPASVTASAADNAAALRLTRTKVAAFQPTQVGAPSVLTVTGAVTVDGKARAGVAITSTSNQASCTATGNTGVYQCTMPAGTSSTFRPVLTGTSFSPATRSVSAIAANLSGYNFSGQTVKYTLGGKITLNGTPLAGVTLQPSLASVTCSVTGSTGLYSCTAPAGSSFTLTPKPVTTGMSFNPARASVSNLQGNLTNANFTAYPAAYSFSVQVYSSAGNLASASLVSSGAATCSGVFAGLFRCTIPYAGSATITARASGWRMSPTAATFSNVRAQPPAQSFYAFR